MKKRKQVSLYVSVVLLVIFVLWTFFVRFVDVEPIGPNGSPVGVAGLNGYVHDIIGVHMPLYTITDWLGIVPIGIVLVFSAIGLIQLIKRKSFFRVDRSILALGGFYIVVIAVYIFFEAIIINYRPVLINGNLEASYPSSTTMLVMCVMPTAIMQFNDRIKNPTLRRCVEFAIIAFIVFIVICRFVSGVHWITDIIGGALLSVGLVMRYHFISGFGKN